MSAYTNTFATMQRADAIIDRFLSATGAKSWASLAEALMPEPPTAAPQAELELFKSWIKYTSMVARGRIEKKLGHRHPDLVAAWAALDDRAIRVTAPITFASRNASAAGSAQARQAREAAELAAKAANAANPDVTRRFPISGAGPYHAGSRDAINLPDDPIPYAWRDRAMRLIGKLFTITRDGRKQGILKQSGMTVIKTLMLNFANGKTGACYPSYEAIAARTGLGRSTVADAIALLSDLGFIEVTNRVKRVPIRGRAGDVIGSRLVQTSNTYRLGIANFLAVAAAAPKDALEAVAGWMEEWQAFLRSLKSILIRNNSNERESRIRAETDPIERYNHPTPSIHARFLRRVCRWRPTFNPTTAIFPSQ